MHWTELNQRYYIERRILSPGRGGPLRVFVEEVLHFQLLQTTDSYRHDCLRDLPIASTTRTIYVPSHNRIEIHACES
jgi:hypothetical protein